MELQESIVQLGAKLDEWFNVNLATFKSQDRVAQGKVLLQGFEIAKQLDRLKAHGLSALTGLLNRQDAVTGAERDAALVQGFAFAAKLAATLHDEFRDTKGETEVAHLRDAIVNTLDALGSGRKVLAVLLDHSDPRVRASAGAYLIKLMPERVIPILRDIEKKEHANSAHFTAYWTVQRWELEGRRAAKA
jgi:hypothetical protein